MAAKHVTLTPAAEREITALKLARKFHVPTVVQFQRDLQHPSVGRVLILE